MPDAVPGLDLYVRRLGADDLAAFFAEISSGDEAPGLVACVARDCEAMRGALADERDAARELRRSRDNVRDLRSALGAGLREHPRNEPRIAYVRELLDAGRFFRDEDAKGLRALRRLRRRWPIVTLEELETLAAHVKALYAQRCEREVAAARAQRLAQGAARRSDVSHVRSLSPPAIGAALLPEGGSLPPGFVPSSSPARVFVHAGVLSKADAQRLNDLHKPGAVFVFIDREGTQFDDAIVSTPSPRSDEQYVVVDAVTRGSNPRLLSTLGPCDRAPRLRRIA